MNIVFESLDNFLFEKKIQPINNKIIQNKIEDFYVSLHTKKEFEKYKSSYANKFEYWIDIYVKSKIKIKSIPTFIKVTIEDTDTNKLKNTFKYIIEKSEGWGWYVGDLVINGHSIIDERDYRVEIKKEDLLKFIEDKDEYRISRFSVTNTILIEIEPNYTQRIEQLPRFIYHVTPFYNIEGIKKKGLIPIEGRDRNLYPSRIYFTVDKKSAMDVLLPLKLRYESEEDIMYNNVSSLEDYVMLKIDTSKLNKGIKFFVDQHFGKEDKGIWTYSNIPKEAITILEKNY